MKNETKTERADSPCNSDRFIKKGQVAQLLQVTTRTVDDYMRRGRIPFYKIGRTVRFKALDVEAHLQATCRVQGRSAFSNRQCVSQLKGVAS